MNKTDEIVALFDQGMSQSEIALQTGVTERTVRRVLEYEALRRAGGSPNGGTPDPTRADLSLTAQQKFDRAIEQEKAKLAGQFWPEVNARVKEFLADTIGPQLRKEQSEAQFVMRSRRKGAMTRKQFNQIRACLHADREASAKEKDDAFVLFTSLEKLLLSEAESPTRFTDIPKTPAEWDALKRKVAEQRRQARKNKNTAIKTR